MLSLSPHRQELRFTRRAIRWVAVVLAVVALPPLVLLAGKLTGPHAPRTGARTFFRELGEAVGDIYTGAFFTAVVGLFLVIMVVGSVAEIVGLVRRRRQRGIDAVLFDDGGLRILTAHQPRYVPLEQIGAFRALVDGQIEAEHVAPTVDPATLRWDAWQDLAAHSFDGALLLRDRKGLSLAELDLPAKTVAELAPELQRRLVERQDHPTEVPAGLRDALARDGRGLLEWLAAAREAAKPEAAKGAYRTGTAPLELMEELAISAHTPLELRAATVHAVTALGTEPQRSKVRAFVGHHGPPLVETAMLAADQDGTTRFRLPPYLARYLSAADRDALTGPSPEEG